MTSVKKCYYEVLGVVKPSNEDEIRKAYKKQAFRWHPDKNPDEISAAEERFKEIGEAYSCLSDKEKKAVYDRFGHQGFTAGHERTPGGRYDPGHFRNFTAFDFRSASDIFNNLFASGFFEDDDHFFGARFNSRKQRTSANRPQRGFNGAFDVFGLFDRFGFDNNFDRMFLRGSRFSGMDDDIENDSADHDDRPVKSTYYKTEYKDGKKVVTETMTTRQPDGTSKVEVTQTTSDCDGKYPVKKKFVQDSKGKRKEIPV